MFLTLFKIRLKSLFSGQQSAKKKKNLSPAIKIGLFAFLGLYILVIFGLMFFGLGSVLFSQKMYGVYFAIAGAISIFLTFVGSVFSIQSQIFNAKDNELLLSMPIRPRDIMLSRLAALVALNYIYSAIVMIPAFVAWCVLGHVTALSVVLFILGNIVLPLFTLAFSCLIVWLVSLLTSRMKHKNLFTTVFMLAAFTAYMYLCMNMSSLISSITDKADEIGGFLTTFVLPLRFFSVSCDPLAGIGSAVANELLLIAVSVIPLVLILALLSKFFIGIATVKTAATGKKYVSRKLKVSNKKLALFKKEFSYFLSLPMYILNCALGALFILIIGVLLIIKGGDLIAMLASDQIVGSFLTDYIPLALTAIIGFCASMTDITAPSISLEGKTLWILRVAPIDAKDVFFGKIAVNLAIGFPPIIITSVISIFTLNVAPGSAVLVMLAGMLMQYCFAASGLYINLLMPKFDWLNETVAIKQSMSVVVTMFGGFLLIGIPVLLFFLVPVFSVLSPTICLILFICYFTLLSAAFTGLLLTNGKKRFYSLSN